MSSPARRLFLLSPAHCGGRRAQMLFSERAAFDLAVQVRSENGAPLGTVFSFLSGLYFRGKLAYARAVAANSGGTVAVRVITTNRGLVDPETFVTLPELTAMGTTSIDETDPAYREPLERDLAQFMAAAEAPASVVLLGSIASGKYCNILLAHCGERLVFPAEFVGRGDMSRGGLLLRAVDEGRELEYIRVDGAVRRGKRPPKLAPRRWTP